MIAVEEVSALRDELVALRREFHANPELGTQEHQTSQRIQEYLSSLGLHPKVISGTGVTAVIRGKNPGSTVMLRADMDALPVREETGLPFASQDPGIMHACAHDGHMAMLLIAAKILTAHRKEFSGAIKLVFQPNEEMAGALNMIREGVLEDPRPDYVLGVHLWAPLPTGTLGLSTGVVMAANDAFFIKIKGKGGHSGSPETAVDPILAASSVVQALQSVQTREISSLSPTAIVVCQMQAGSAPNIIPETADLAGSIRYLYQGNGAEQPLRRLKRVAEAACRLYNCTCDVRFVPSNPCVLNHEHVVAVGKVAAKRIGTVHVVSHVTLAGEDFGEFAARVPGAFCFIGAGNPEKGCTYPHHHPRFDIDEEALPLGTAWLCETALSLLNQETI